LPGALGVLLLLALLTWLLLRGTAYAVTLRAFDDFSLAEASLHRDVLQGARRPASRLHTLVKTRQRRWRMQLPGFVPTRRPRASTRDQPTAEAGISEVLRRALASSEIGSALARCLRSSGTLQP